MTSRRQLGYVVGLCLAGAALALLSATRTWEVAVTARPAPLPPVTTVRTGAQVLPWLPAVAAVAAAGAIALLATRAAARSLVALVVAAAGLSLLVGAGNAVVSGMPVGWPAVAGVGGAALAFGGGRAARRGRAWPALGARFDRRSAPDPPFEVRPAADRRRAADDAPAAPAAGGAVAGHRSLNTVLAWDAIDRGEDPTDL